MAIKSVPKGWRRIRSTNALRSSTTSITSIVNRIAGIALLGGAMLVVWWLMAAATSEAYFNMVDGLLTSILEIWS